jgi:hypothetical protein
MRLKLARASFSKALSLVTRKAGAAKVTSTPIMTTTMINSIKVKLLIATLKSLELSCTVSGIDLTE